MSTLTKPPVTAPPTSRGLQHLANELCAGRHPLVVGAIGDLVLLQGEALSWPDAVERMARGPFDVVVRVNAVDVPAACGHPAAVEEVLGRSAADEPAEAPADVPEREQRLAALRRAAPPAEPDVIDTVRRALAQDRHSVLVVVEQADILLQDPAHHDEADRERVARLQLALGEARHVGRYRNTCVLLAGLVSAVPRVILAGTEEVGVVDVTAPTRADRAHVLAQGVVSMRDGERLGEADRERLAGELADLTDGATLSSVASLAPFSRAGGHSVLEPRELVFRHRFGDRPDHWSHLASSLADCRALLESRVFGQPAAVNAVMGALCSAALGLTFSLDPHAAESLPRGLLWFVGPTGVGKTELARALAEAAFGEAEAYLRLDMSTFAQEHAAERLMGAPPGFVGFEQGGELTNAVRARPNSVILLDEIEKAHPRALDRLMSIFDDGRVVDAQGRTTYFGDTIIVATSNEGSDALAALVAAEGEALTYEQVKVTSVAAVRSWFEAIGRPEIYGRIEPGVVAFDVLRVDVVDQIVAKLAGAARFRTGPHLTVDVPSAATMARLAMADPTQRALGGRQVRNLLQRHLRDASTWIADHGHLGADRAEVGFVGGDVLVSIDGAAPQPVT